MIEAMPKHVDLRSWLTVLERIVEDSSNMVVVTDANMKITWVNQKYTCVTGWALEELRGAHAGKYTHGVLTDKGITALISSSLREGKSISGVELINYRKSGEPYTVLLNIEPIRDESNEIVSFFSIQSDITERRKLENENAQLSYHLQAAQELLKLGLIKFDRKTLELHWSSAVNDIYEIDISKKSGKLCDLTIFMPPIAKEKLLQNIDHSIATGKKFNQEFPIISGKGNRRWVRFSGAPERERDVNSTPDTWTIQDITTDKLDIEQKRLNNERLRAMVLERTKSLEDANHSLESFTHAISHDLKKPIRHMVSYSEIVMESIAAEDSRAALAYCEKILKAGKRLSSLVDGLLTFSRLGRRGLNYSSVDMRLLLNECLTETAASFRTQAYSASGIEYLPTIYADPVLMYEVWSNLLDNAFKFAGMRELIHLQFSCNEEPDGWTMSVSDNGRGIDKNLASSIFEMFFRASDDAIGGDGIGLAMCRRIVESHGGRIWAEPAIEVGTTFYVYLPRSSPESGFGPLSAPRN